MLYGALSQDCDSSCSSFYIKSGVRSDDENLLRLVNTIKTSKKVLSKEYFNLNDLAEQIYSDVTLFITSKFPENIYNRDIKQNWYTSELQRYYIVDEQAHTFLDKYNREEHVPILLYGNCFSGKTSLLTNWAKAQKMYSIIISCTADDNIRYWPELAREIIRKITEKFPNIKYPDFKAYASMFFWLIDNFKCEEKDMQADESDFYFVTNEDVEDFRQAFVNWLSKLPAEEGIIIVINDLQLIRKWGTSEFFSWLSNFTSKNVHIYASTNEQSIVDIFKHKQWNCIEKKDLSKLQIRNQLVNYLNFYGKHLSDKNVEDLCNSCISGNPGMTKVVADYLISNATYQTLQHNIERISYLTNFTDIFRFIVDSICFGFNSATQEVFKDFLCILHLTRFALDEYDVYNILQSIHNVSGVDWVDLKSHAFPFLDISQDRLQINAKVINVFLQTEVLIEEKKKILNHALGNYYSEKFVKYSSDTYCGKNHHLKQIKQCTDSAVEMLFHYRKAESWEELYQAVKDITVLYYLSKLNWEMIKSAWISLLNNTDYTLFGAYKIITEKCAKFFNNDFNNDYHNIYFRILQMCDDFGYHTIAKQLDCAMVCYKDIHTSKINKSSRNIINLFTKKASKSERKQIMDFSDKEDLYVQNHFDTILQEFMALKSSGREMDAIILAEKVLGNFELAQKARLLGLCVETCLFVGLTEKAAGYAEQLFELAINMTDFGIFVDAMIAKGRVLYKQGNFKKTLHYFEQAQKACLAQGDLKGYYAILDDIGKVLRRNGDYESAESCYITSMNGYYKTGDIKNALATKLNLSNLYLFCEEEEKAFETCLQICVEAKRIENGQGIYASAVGNLGHISLMMNKPEAEKYALESFKIAKKIGHLESMFNSTINLIQLYRDKGFYGKGIVHLQEVEEIFAEHKMMNELCELIDSELEFLQLAHLSDKLDERKCYWDTRFLEITGGITNYSLFENNHFHVMMDTRNYSELLKQEKLYCDAYDIPKLFETLNERFNILAYQKHSFLEAISVLDELIRISKQYYEHENFAQDYLAKKFLFVLEAKLKNKNFENFDEVAFFREQLQLLTDVKLSHFFKLWYDLLNELKNSNIKKIKTILLNIYMNFLGNDIDINYLFCFSEGVSSIVADKFFSNILEDIFSAINENSRTSNELKDKLKKILLSPSKEKVFDILIVLQRDYKQESTKQLLEFCEKIIILALKINDADAASLAGNIALIFRRLGDKDKTFYYHKLSAQRFQEENRKRDALIEMLNLSSAYSSFNYPGDAISKLREAKEAALDMEESGILAAICGNLASLLFSTKGDYYEIKDLYEYEENYYYSNKEYRELVISLINQYKFYCYYDARIAAQKLEEAISLIKQYKLHEFDSMISGYSQLKFRKSISEENFDMLNDKIKEWMNEMPGTQQCQIVEKTSDGSIFFRVVTDEKSIYIKEVVVKVDAKSAYLIIQVTAHSKITRENLLHDITNYINWWKSVTRNYIDYDVEKDAIIFEMIFEIQNTDRNFVAYVDKMFMEFNQEWEKEEMILTLISFGIDDIEMIKKIRLDKFSEDGNR